MDLNIDVKYKSYSPKTLHFGEFNQQIYFEFVGNTQQELKNAAINTPWYFLEKDQALKLASEILKFYKDEK